MQRAILVLVLQPHSLQSDETSIASDNAQPSASAGVNDPHQVNTEEEVSPQLVAANNDGSSTHVIQPRRPRPYHKRNNRARGGHRTFGIQSAKHHLTRPIKSVLRQNISAWSDLQDEKPTDADWAKDEIVITDVTLNSYTVTFVECESEAPLFT